MFKKQPNHARSPSTQLLFWRQLRQNFQQTGALLPSSKQLGHAMTNPLRRDVAKRTGGLRILEAGAGTGVFTQQIIPLLGADDQFDIVEICPTFTQHLQQRLHQTGAIQATKADVRLINADLCRFPITGTYDFIIFSLPLVNFAPTIVENLLAQMMASLKQNGIFSYFTYLLIGHVKRFFSSPLLRADVDVNRQIIQKFSQKYQVGREIVLPNVGPAWVHYWQKY